MDSEVLDKIPDGFVLNQGNRSIFRAQRMLVPGFKLSFKDAYTVFHKKCPDIEPKEFPIWLRKNVFPEDDWKFCRKDGRSYFVVSGRGPRDPCIAPEKLEALRQKAKGKHAPPPPTKQLEQVDPDKITNRDIQAAHLVLPPYETASILIDRCSHRATLKKALALSRHLSGRERHMLHILRRLDQVTVG